MVNKEQEHFMQMAIDLSQYALNNDDRSSGAIIVKNGNIVGSSGKYVFRDIDPFAHAEVIAIRDACRNLKSLDLSGCDIYSSSEPCPMCLAAIYWAQISSIYYCNFKNETIVYGGTGMGKSIFQHIQKSEVIRQIKSEQVSKSKALEIFESDLNMKNQQNFTVNQE